MILRINFTPEKVNPALKDAAASILLEGRAVGEIILKSENNLVRLEISSGQVLVKIKEFMNSLPEWTNDFKGLSLIPVTSYIKNGNFIFFLDQRVFEIEAC